ncbi:MAG: diaminopropionate ammonia-lyase [Proteobacteria bacterium]|nr:diaminopropionate ammonia-lyase [Pseudomonadota bacterium]MDA0992023.1 diaminopropionate ammonia-lyase [Pseudomonadota bacterium]
MHDRLNMMPTEILSPSTADTELSAFSGVAVGHFANPARIPRGEDSDDAEPLFSEKELNKALGSIMAWPNYEPTPLRPLACMAKKLGIAHISYKDEAGRFGLGSFKALGGAYAVSCLLGANSTDVSSITVASATDGNHGLSVAWGARTHGCRCVIFIHANVSAGREQALKSQGAEVVRIDGNYDESVRQCFAEAAHNGWIVISDTTKDDSGSDVARTVMAGYSVMVAEIVEQLGEDVPTHVFIQGGVGGLAATVCEYLRLNWTLNTPRFVIVEPVLAPCLFESARSGRRVSVDVREETVMAGLSCGEVSAIAWPTLYQYADDFLTIPDSTVAPTMRLLADAPYGDVPIVAGESAVAGLAGLISVTRQEALSSSLQLNKNSRVLVIGTEGATDPVLYESVTGRPVASVLRARI